MTAIFARFFARRPASPGPLVSCSVRARASSRTAEARWKGICGLLASVTLLAPAFLGQAFAYDFAPANALYKRRTEGRATIAAARDAYTKAARSTQGAELLFSVERIARLEYYEGLIVPESDSRTHVAIYSRCLSEAEAISPQRIGPTPHYYYMKAACLAAWGQANGIVSSLARLPELLNLLDAGLKLDRTFEGGGLYRVAAGVYAKLAQLDPLVFNRPKHLAKAKSFIDAAIASPAFGSPADPDANPEKETGDYFFDVWEFKAEILALQGKRGEARQVLQDAIGRIESGDLPPAREPETLAILPKLKAVLSRL